MGSPPARDRADCRSIDSALTAAAREVETGLPEGLEPGARLDVVMPPVLVGIRVGLPGLEIVDEGVMMPSPAPLITLR